MIFKMKFGVLGLEELLFSVLEVQVVDKST